MVHLYSIMTSQNSWHRTILVFVSIKLHRHAVVLVFTSQKKVEPPTPISIHSQPGSKYKTETLLFISLHHWCNRQWGGLWRNFAVEDPPVSACYRSGLWMGEQGERREVPCGSAAAGLPGWPLSASKTLQNQRNPFNSSRHPPRQQVWWFTTHCTGVQAHIDKCIDKQGTFCCPQMLSF